MVKLVSFSPVTLEKVGSVEATDVKDLPAIIQRSREAQKKWATYTPKERARFMHRLAVITADESDWIAKTVFDETGKPKAEAFNMEAYVAASSADYCSTWLKKFKFEKKLKLTPVDGMMMFLRRRSEVIYRPLGVVVSIAPSNFPFCIPFTETATAVAAGNAVIVKPSPDTPLTGEIIGKLYEKAGFPKGLVTVVNGDGVGEALTASKDIDRIMFTGSTRTGKAIMASAAQNLTPLTLELGGCDPAIVLKDADLLRTVPGLVWGAFINAGQVCVGMQRLLVHRSIYEKFVEMFLEQTNALKMGAGWDDPSISIGPVINEAAIKRLDAAVQKAKDAGGRVLCGGSREPTLKGWFFQPTVVVDLPIDSPIFNEEVFGPYVTITPFDDEDEAIRIANSSEYALGGSVWTKDWKHGREIAKKVTSRIMDVNNGLYNYGMPTTPWGGSKASGFGTSHGNEGFRSLMQEQHIHTDKGFTERDPWWMPYDEKSTQMEIDLTKGFYGSHRHPLRVLIGALPLIKRKK
jgi:acyl-CoA reductase-like NAD-dependent aldehyde dehydrogenase